MAVLAEKRTRLESYRKKALALYRERGGLRYSFTHFEGLYAELTYYLVHHVLAEKGLEFLSNTVMTLLRECISNAVKANLKRVYFEKSGVDLGDKAAYARLMQSFKEDGVCRLSEHIGTMKQMGLAVELRFDVQDDKIRFVVENNASMTAQELLRVRNRIDAAARLSSMPEAFEKFEDDVEGAGLGIIISIMLLKKSGIGPENFRIASDDSKTRVSISIPRDLKIAPEIQSLYEEVHKEIEAIPTFPQNVKKLVELCDDPKSDTSQIIRQIEVDPSLATSLLRLANSGGFVTGNRVQTIQHAVAVIGIQNLRQLAMALSSRKILEHQYKTYSSFWQHAEKCASYARLLAQRLGFAKKADTVYLGGLLHDLGKIILLALEPEKIEEIQKINLGRSENSSAILEEISLGLSHTRIGYRLAKHWNFPEEVCDVIRYHHSVYAAESNYLAEVSLVHLADAFLRTEKANVHYVYYDETCLSELGIDNLTELSDLHESIREDYEKSLPLQV